MLILAGVSLNAIVGDNGIITMAQKAKEQYEFAAVCEELEQMMFEFNTTGETGSSSLKAYMNKQIENGKIDSFRTMRKDNTMQFVIEKEGHIFYAVPDGSEYWKVVSVEGDSAFVDGTELQVYTTENINSSGTFDLGKAGKETDVVFYEKIEDKLNFEIKEGVVNIYIYDDMILTNSGMKRSAIDIYEGATLNLYLEEGATMIVDSGYGVAGETGNASGAKGGAGGFAGIHVPSTEKGIATFSVYGDGTLKAFGGNASSGGRASEMYGGGRRWPELELVLVEMVGVGGNGSSTQTQLKGKLSDGSYTDDPKVNTNAGSDGGNGENCGIINIYDDIIVLAYGGSGASGGTAINSSGGGRRWRLSSSRHWSVAVLAGGRRNALRWRWRILWWRCRNSKF